MEESRAKEINQISFREFFSQGDVGDKLSFILMGVSNIIHQQILKGCLFLISEIAFVSWFILFGIRNIISMITLGTAEQSWLYDAALEINIRVSGDNSMLLLIYGIATILAAVAFGFLYVASLKSGRKNFFLREQGLSIPNFRTDLKSLLDEKFHLTLMSIPLLGVIIFTVLPLVYMISLAFTSYDHNHLPPRNLFDWVGLVNFGNVLNGRISGTFFPLLGWTLIWAVLATVTSFFFGVLLAMLINSKGIKGKKIFRTLFVLTMAVPQFISLLIMQNMLHASGPINTLLENWGWISGPIPFLTDGLMAKISIVVVNMWIGIPVSMLVTTGIIMNLPEEQIEAARIDGANKFHIFRYITFPQILFVMAPSLIQQFIGNINNFNVIYLLTGGGPLNSDYYSAGETDLLVTWLYKLTVEVADYNIASVIGIITFVLSAVFSLFAYTRSGSYKKEGEI
ncbi:carbohydrate ABC transporter permease [Enterococcus sp. HY326]|uniref:carbohydrate ABC transporter permease n=1 Tax=Enterococcus sp. HY326 TaxID=2971265 RepID=UPI00223FD1F3|nr:sugar ABC transporter permease [Enterococcus sp. HY326]